MKTVLTAEAREISGSKVSKLRKDSLIPAVVYGPDLKPAKIQVNARSFAKVFAAAGETQTIELMVGDQKIPALVHDLQRDPISNSITHIDFLQISMNRPIHAEVPLKFEGISPAAKSQGAVIVTTLREIEVKALPNNIPAFLSVDLGALHNYHDEILVSDLKLPADVTLVTNQDLSIVSALPPRTQTELEALNEKVEAKVEDVETLKQKTPEEKAAEAAAAKTEGEKGEKPAAAQTKTATAAPAQPKTKA